MEKRDSWSGNCDKITVSATIYSTLNVTSKNHISLINPE